MLPSNHSKSSVLREEPSLDGFVVLKFGLYIA